jgi:hypothetical protein
MAGGIDADDDHVFQLGRMAIACGSIELNAARITELLLSPESGVGDLVTAMIDNFGRTITLATRLVTVVLRSDASNDKATLLADGLDKWLPDAKVVMDQRNRYLHAEWLIHPRRAEQSVDDALIQHRKSSDNDPRQVPIAELRAHVEEALVVAATGDELLAGALDWRGHLDDLMATLPDAD